MNLQELIKEIIPFYNFHRKNQIRLSGTEALENIWEVGNLLKSYLDVNTDIAPRTLYHQIYGKSEQARDISQKSYITRDFLDRAYRVRRIFKKKSDIKKMFPSLQRYRLFYKSMPFLDDGRFKMNQTDQQKLISLLNSTKSYKEIITEVERLKTEKIGLKIPHDSKLKELENERQIFISVYNQVYSVLKESRFNEVVISLPFFCDKPFIKLLSQNTGALSSDQLKMSRFKIPVTVVGDGLLFAQMINKFAEQKDAKERRRFRRLIPPERMMRLSEMLHALTDEQSFNTLKTR
jgi:hypothetical protein